MEKQHYSIAIDGPGGAGKSTIARRAAAGLGLGYGAIYRAGPARPFSTASIRRMKMPFRLCSRRCSLSSAGRRTACSTSG